MKGIAAYKQAEVNSSDSVRIITLLMEGCVNFIKMAEKKLDEGDIAGKGLYVSKATAIVTELMNSLDLEKGMEIAQNLSRLYDFVLDRLVEGNLKNDRKALEEACRVMEILAEGWKELEKQGPAVQGGMEKPVESGIRI